MKNSPLNLLEDFYTEHLATINNTKFTKREIDVIACILHGRTAKGSAILLSILPRTIQVHNQNIRNKLGVSSREGIINFIELSDKFSLVRNYYSKLLVECAFEKKLDEISKLKLQQNNKLLVVYGIKIKDKKSFFEKLERNLEKVGIESLISKYKTNQIDEEKKISSQIHIMFAEEEMKNNSDTFLNKKFINLSVFQEYYFVFFEILVKIASNIDLEKIYVSFKEQIEGFQDPLFISSTRSSYKKDAESSISIIHDNVKTSKQSFLYFILYMIFLICFLFLFYLNKNSFIKYFPSFSPFFSENKTKSIEAYPKSWNLPRQNIVFIGRKSLLENLKNKLHQDPSINSKKTLVISTCAGLGGIGKTQLALHYIHHTNHPYTFKAWFPAENIESLYKNYTQLAESLGYKGKEITKDKILIYIKKWLSEHPGWLLVYDNVNNYEEIAPFLPEKGGYIILTTRQRSWPINFNIISVDVMKEDEAIKLLSSFVPTTFMEEKNEVKKVAKTLGYLPLALAQAGAYMRQNHVSFLEYLNLYKHHEMELLMDKTLPEGENVHPVAVTWDISLKAIIKETQSDKEGPLAIELLTVCAYLSPEKISHKILLAWLQECHSDLLSPTLTLNKHIGLLWKYSMIDYNADYISIHRLVQSVLRDRLQNSLENNNILCTTLNLQWYEFLLRFFIDNENEFKLSNSFEQLIETSERFKEKFKNRYNNTLAELDLTLSPIYFNQEKYSEFLNIINKVNNYIKDKKGLEFLKCKALYLHSAYFRKMNNYQEAENKINEAFKIFKKIKITGQLKSNDLKNLNSKLIFNKVNIYYAKNKKKNEAERNYKEIEVGIKLIKKSISISAETQNRRDWLREIELLGRLLVLAQQGLEAIKEFNKYNALIERLADDRTKMLFYLTYSDAYFIQGDLKNSLIYCNKAKNLAGTLNLRNELENIKSKEIKIRDHAMTPFSRK